MIKLFKNFNKRKGEIKRGDTDVNKSHLKF